MPRFSAYFRRYAVGMFLSVLSGSALGQVDGNALTSSLMGKTVISTVELAYSATVGNSVIVNGRPAVFPAKTLIYPDGHLRYRVEHGILHAEADKYTPFKIGIEYRVSKVELKDEFVELQMPSVMNAKQEADVKVMLGKGWQQTMTTEKALSIVSAYLPNTEQLAKRQADAEAKRAEDARLAQIAAAENAKQAQIAAEVNRKAAEQARAEAQARADASAAEHRAETEKKLDQALLTKAKAGDAEAQYLIGRAYSYGTGGAAKSDVDAIYWFRKSAEQGNAKGENALGVSYEYGTGVGKDYVQAVAWLRKAADQGNSKAEDNLGDAYYNGWGIQKDFTRALDLYKKAAAQGDSNAQFSLGYMYANGDIGKADFTQAALWYRKSAEQGNNAAQNNLGLLYANGQGVAGNILIAKSWYKKAADQGNVQAKTNLANLEKSQTETTTADDADQLFFDVANYVLKVIVANNDAMPQCGFDGNRTLLTGLDTESYLRGQYNSAQTDGRRALIVAIQGAGASDLAIRAAGEAWKSHYYDRDGCFRDYGSSTSSTISAFARTSVGTQGTSRTLVQEVSQEANRLLEASRKRQVSFDGYVRNVLAHGPVGAAGRYEKAARALVGADR